MYAGDIRLGETIDIKFTTRQFTTGAPFTLAGSPAVAAYVGNGTTEITAGITLSVDFDSRTGLNNVRVVASGGNGFATATNVSLVITAGTVDGVSVVGEVVGSFSIEARSALMPTTAARTLLVDAAGNADTRLADAVAHGGTPASSTATLALSRMAVVSQTANTAAVTATGNGTGSGINAASGAGATGDGITASSSATNGNGVRAIGNGTGAGLRAEAASGGTGSGLSALGGGGGGAGIRAQGQAAEGFLAIATGAGGSGLKATPGSGGIPIEGNITGNITGNLSGSVGSVTADVGITQAGADKVWASAARTLTSFGSLVADVATAVWGAATRILTAATNITSTGGTTVPQTGDSFARLGAPAGASVSADIAAVNSNVSAVGVAVLTRATPAQVNAEVLDVIATDTFAEPTGVPAATATLATKIGRLHQALRNGLTVTATAKTFNDDAASPLWKKPLSDDGTTYTEGEGTTP